MNVIQNISRRPSRKVEKHEYKSVVVPMIPQLLVACARPIGKNGGAYAIAHCQVNQEDPMRFFVMASGMAIVNPVIKDRIGKPIWNSEGCMSFAFRDDKKVRRYPGVVVEYVEVNIKGKAEAKSVTLMGRDAMIFQHELDHMNGVHIYP